MRSEQPRISDIPFGINDCTPVDELPQKTNGKIKASTVDYWKRRKLENGFADVLVRIGKKDHVIEPRLGPWLATRVGVEA